jgi:hypothetical protein
VAGTANRAPPRRPEIVTHPDNGTYERQSWSFADPLQGPTDAHDSDWLSDIRAIGAEHDDPTIEW